MLFTVLLSGSDSPSTQAGGSSRCNSGGPAPAAAAAATTMNSSQTVKPPPVSGNHWTLTNRNVPVISQRAAWGWRTKTRLHARYIEQTSDKSAADHMGRASWACKSLRLTEGKCLHLVRPLVFNTLHLNKLNTTMTSFGPRHITQSAAACWILNIHGVIVHN